MGAAYGGTRFLEIGEQTGKVTELGKAIEERSALTAQGLGAIDRKHGIVYVISFNGTNSDPYLLGFDSAHGNVVVEVALPFEDLVFVGLGQALDVDPLTGDVIAIGQSKVVHMHHEVVRVDFKTKHVTTLTTVKFEATNIAILGGQANTLDYKNQVEYMTLPLNQSGKILIDIVAIDLKTGKVTKFLQQNPATGQIILSMDYDEATGN